MRTIGNAGSSARRVEAIASGTMSTGDTVVVNADGTVSVVAETSVSQSLGSSAVFESATVDYISSAYDSNAQKVVIAYRDEGNSSYGTAVVGTVSGTSISFGTPAVFESAAIAYVSATYDSNAQKVVIAYRDNASSFYGYAVVGAVSGTSVSFGSPTVFEAALIDYISATYDANAQKVVIAYQDQGNSNYGTAVVGTVSGTSISFGTPVVFESANSQYNSAAYESNAQKIVIAYTDAGNSEYGTAIVGTVSGTSISFGSPVVFESAATAYHSATYDSNAQKIVVAYRDTGNSDYGTAVVGTVSGTSISFGSAVVFESAGSYYMSSAYDSTAQKVVIIYADSGNSSYGTLIVGTVSGTSISFGSPVVFENAFVPNMSAIYDSNAQKVVISYRNEGNLNYGTAAVFQNAYTAINLTASNFIGFADYGVADGQAVVVNTRGAIAENQTGLTAGQKYYVQTDGTLSTTAGSPSVEAGTAVAADKIIVKG